VKTWIWPRRRAAMTTEIMGDSSDGKLSELTVDSNRQICPAQTLAVRRAKGALAQAA